MVDVEHMRMNSGYMDYPEHERTYQGFTFAAKWGTIVVTAIVILLALFLL